jgi:cytochrome c biogenesis DsbD-like protein
MRLRLLQSATLFVSLFLLTAACAKAPADPAQKAQSNANASDSPAIKSVDVVKVSPQEATIARGQSGDVVVPIKIKDGYHVNANPPTFPYLKPTELELPQSKEISVEFISYPDPLKRKFSFTEGKELAVYEGDAIIKAHIKADKSAKPGKRNLSAKLRVQACDDKVCYAPGVLDVALPLDIK